MFLPTYITVPAEFPTDLLAYAGTLWTDLQLVILLALGLPLGFWMIRKAMGLVRTR